MPPLRAAHAQRAVADLLWDLSESSNAGAGDARLRPVRRPFIVLRSTGVLDVVELVRRIVPALPELTDGS
jgi:hypothetical protein